MCRQIPPEIAHIVPYRDVRAHDFENLIALCPTCHARFDARQIDLLSMRQYKANLALLSSRYGELERRVLEYFADNPRQDSIFLPDGLRLLTMYLVKDGLLAIMPRVVPRTGLFSDDEYRLTDVGRAFITSWIESRPLDIYDASPAPVEPPGEHPESG